MKFEQAFDGVARLFLDTAPVIYYVERNSIYFAIVQPIFLGIQNNTFQAVIDRLLKSEATAS